MTAIQRDRDGRVLLAAQLLDHLAFGVAGVALPWLVQDGGGSTTLAGLVATATLFPYVIAGLPAGVLADRVDGRRLIRASHVLQTLVALVIPLWGLAGHPPAAVILLVALLIGSLRAFVDAGIFGALAAIAGPEEFPRSQAVLTTAWTVGLVLGPLLGAQLIGAVGASAALVAEAASFALASLLALLVRRPLPAPGGGLRPLAAAREGLAYIVRHPLVRGYTVVNVVWNLGTYGTVALLVPLVREIGLSPREAGAVFAAGAVMGMLTAPAIALLRRRTGPIGVVVIGIAASALAAGLLAGAAGVALAAAGAGLRGLVDWVLISTFVGERQRHAPAALQARIGMTGRMVAVIGMSGGGALASMLAGPLEVRVVYALMAAFAVACIVPAGLVLRRAAGRVATA